MNAYNQIACSFLTRENDTKLCRLFEIEKITQFFNTDETDSVVLKEIVLWFHGERVDGSRQLQHLSAFRRALRK